MDFVWESDISVSDPSDFLSTSNQTSAGSLTVDYDLMRFRETEGPY